MVVSIRTHARNALALYLGGCEQDEVGMVSEWFMLRDMNHTVTKSQSCWSLYFKVDDAAVLKDRIAKYMPECMMYKLENVRI